MSLRIEVIDDVAVFDQMHDEWNGAALANIDPNVFLTWEWLRTWWRHFGETNSSARLHVTVIRDDDGLVALAPFYVARNRLGPVAAIALRPISYNAGDYGGIVLVRRSADAVGALLEHLRGMLVDHDVDTVVLPRLTTDSTYASELGAAMTAVGDRMPLDGVWATQKPLDDACPFADVRDGYNLARHLKKHKVRQRMRRISEQHEISFDYHTGGTLDEGMERLIRVHTRRWADRRGELQGLLAEPRREAFLRDAVRALDSAGWVQLVTLQAGDHTVAAELDFEFAKRVYMFKAAFDPDFAEYSPGQLVTYRLFDEGIARGVHEFDFMRGDHPYKRRWATGARDLVTVNLSRAGWTGRLAARRHRLAQALQTRTRHPPRTRT